MGHPFKYIFIDVEPTAKGCGVLSHYVPECKTRGPYTVPPNLHRNVDNGQLRIAQQGGGTFDPPGEQGAVRRNAERVTERSSEVSFRDAADLCKLRDRPASVRFGVNRVSCAQQAAKQFNVPVYRVLPFHTRRSGLHSLSNSSSSGVT